MFFLSIIIAAHNAEKTLDSTLQSLLTAIGNASNEIEIIIVNDSSSDTTQYIIEYWMKKFLHITSRKVTYCNIGKVRNIAISLSSGEYITMLDSDDRMKSNSLEDAVVFLKKNRPDILLTHLIEIHNIDKINDIWGGFHPKILTKEEAIRNFLLHKDFQAHLIGQFMQRKLYIRNPVPSFICYEDFAIFPKLLMQAKKILYQHQGHYFYVKRHDSLSNTFTTDKISLLIACTLQMEKIFPPKYQHLINCHWFNIYSKHLKYLDSDQCDMVKIRINQLYSLSFFMSRRVRFIYKKKIFKEKWKK